MNAGIVQVLNITLHIAGGNRMSKKMVWSIILAILMAIFCVVTYFYQPIPFHFIEDDLISIVYVDFSLENGRANQSTKQYSIQVDSLEFQQMKEIFEKYSYHRSLDTIFSDASISGASKIFMICTNGVSMTIGNVPEIIMQDKVYRVGYWGSSEINDLNNELLEILSNVEPTSSYP